ncbi:AEC family transporter [Salinivibrio sp. IB643]|jgi:Predicted permeases|uniref:AEC family transporter n=1 Tax=Salinivibrio TaxID=51366 RepID=UPI000989282D|nr:AEC family transporter [Salinivibrio sp. IB643]OOE96900.1 transporter [Salinivibrio sp. IB643]
MVDLLFQLSFSLSIVAPIFFIITLGYTFRRINWIDPHFIDIASKLVFRIGLPAMLFISIATANHNFLQAIDFLTLSVILTVAFFLICTLSTKLFFKHSKDHGVLIQGCFRANTSIVGVAYVDNAFGSQGVALAALYIAVITVVYNIQAVICLSPHKRGTRSINIAILVTNLAKNPLIIAITLGLLVAISPFALPNVIVDTGNYLAKMTLPLALICTGGSLNLKMLRNNQGPTWFASSYKLVIAPLLFTLFAYYFGFRGVELGVLFFMNAAPVAAASYAMVLTSGGDTTLCANLIGLTTLLSSLTVCLGTLALTLLEVI